MLQVECGHNTVSKIKTMFEDMIKSEQTRADFKKLNRGTTIIKDVDFSVEILTNGHWPR